jgi:hypothetical protein
MYGHSRVSGGGGGFWLITPQCPANQNSALRRGMPWARAAEALAAKAPVLSFSAPTSPDVAASTARYVISRHHDMRCHRDAMSIRRQRQPSS